VQRTNVVYTVYTCMNVNASGLGALNILRNIISRFQIIVQKHEKEDDDEDDEDDED
jgi:hypothetical protein